MNRQQPPKAADRVAHALSKTETVANFRIKHGYYPYTRGKSAKLGRWLSGRRQAMKGTNSGIWYPECETLAIELGCPDMFNFSEAPARLNHALALTRKVAAYVNKRGIYPTGTSKTGTARKMSGWLNGMRGAKAGTHTATRRLWYPECEGLATALGVPDMFNYQVVERLTLGLENTRMLCEYWKAHGRYPKCYRHNTDKAEQRLMNFRSTMRALRVLGYPPFEKEWRMACEALAVELGCPNLFIPTNHEEIAIDNTIAVIKYIKLHGRYPTSNELDQNSRLLAYWINRAIRTRNGYDVRYNWYPECEAVAEALGEPELFYFRREPTAEYVTDWA